MRKGMMLTLACLVGTSAATAQSIKSMQNGKKPTAEQAFKKLDKDANGSLSKDELRGLYPKVPPKFQPIFNTRFEAEFKKYDKDEDDALSLDEFKVLYADFLKETKNKGKNVVPKGTDAADDAPKAKKPSTAQPNSPGTSAAGAQ